MTDLDLLSRQCQPCRAGTPPLEPAQVSALLAQLEGWTAAESAAEIRRVFHFKNYYQTLAFVNAVGWIAHSEDHHPTLIVHYNHCEVRYSTHAVKGLSENDFICAARIDALTRHGLP